MSPVRMRSLSGAVTAAAVLVAIALLILGSIWSLTLPQALSTLAVSAAVGFLVWWYWVWPQVQVSDQGIIVRNMLRTSTISWRIVEEADSHLGLSIRLVPGSQRPQRVYSGAFSGSGFSRRKVESPTESTASGAGKLAFTNGRGAAEMINAWSTREGEANTGPLSLRRDWNWLPLALQLVLLVVAAFLVLR